MPMSYQLPILQILVWQLKNQLKKGEKKMLFKTIFFRGQEVKITKEKIPAHLREPEYYYYEMRHSDHNFDLPLTIEKRVAFNFCGTMITKEPLEMTEKSYGCTEPDYTTIKRNERQLFLDWEGKKCS